MKNRKFLRLGLLFFMAMIPLVIVVHALPPEKEDDFKGYSTSMPLDYSQDDPKTKALIKKGLPFVELTGLDAGSNKNQVSVDFQIGNPTKSRVKGSLSITAGKSELLLSANPCCGVNQPFDLESHYGDLPHYVIKAKRTKNVIIAAKWKNGKQQHSKTFVITPQMKP